NLISLDTCASLVGLVTPEYGDIAPGKTSPGSKGQYILFSNNSPNNTYTRFRLDIASDGYTFWSDTFSVFIYPTSVRETNSKQKIPSEFTLHQNYPNPFNPETRIRYEVPKQARIMLKVMNLLGQKVGTLVNEDKPAGCYEVTWNGKDDHGQRVASGIYLYRLESGDFVQTRKMIFLQ
ncbi:MAG: T9SS type A sorting domain-containing protein, partial [bacterium]